MIALVSTQIKLGKCNNTFHCVTEVLYKPVERVMRTTLVLQDLLKYTPHRHPDYSVLREVSCN